MSTHPLIALATAGQSGDRYVDGKCPGTCPNYQRMSGYIVEYQAEVKTLKTKVKALQDLVTVYADAVHGEE